MRARHSRGAAPAAVAVVALLQLAALATCSSAQPGGAPAVGCLEAATLALRADILAKVAANATNSDNVTSAVRSGLATFASCLNVTSLLNFEPVRIMTPKLGGLDRWRDYAVQFEKLTGVKVILNPIEPFWDISKEIVFDVANTRLSDGYIFEPSITGTVAALGGFADLTSFIQADPNMRFSDYNRFYREVSAVYNKRVIGLPTDGDLFLLYYRADYLKTLNLTVPRTWDELLEVARASHKKIDTDGDGTPDNNGACFNFFPDRCQGHWMLLMVAASHLQYKGTEHGVFFDPDTVPPRPLADNEGMLVALRFWRELNRYGTPSKWCLGHSVDFISARCTLTISWGDNFKLNRKYLSKWPQLVGISPLPGSAQVVDRATGRLVPCTPQLCPYATEHVDARTKQKVWVNTVPFAALGGWTGAVSAFTTPARQLNVFRFLAFLTSPANSWEDVLNFESGVDPFRDEHLTNMSRWTGAGYDFTQTRMYLQATQTSLSSRNIALDTRLAYDSVADLNYWDPYNLAVMQAINLTTNSTDEDLVAIMQALNATLTKRINAAVARYMPGRPVELTQQYWDILGRPGSALSLLPNPPPPPPAPSSPPQATSSGGLPGTAVLAAVLGTVGACALLAAAVAMALSVRRANGRRHRNMRGQVLPPGPGAQTTLVITDVQDSTLLFECLPVSVVDMSMQLLCGTTRELLNKHDGYESCTEGDSFILAFHTAHAALSFSIDLQAALLTQPWPQEVLEADGVHSVRSVWAVPLGKAAACSSMMVGQRSQRSVADMGSAARVRWAKDDPAADTSHGRTRRTRSGWLGRLLARDAAPQARPSPGGDLHLGYLPALKSCDSYYGRTSDVGPPSEATLRMVGASVAGTSDEARTPTQAWAAQSWVTGGARSHLMSPSEHHTALPALSLALTADAKQAAPPSAGEPQSYGELIKSAESHALHGIDSQQRASGTTASAPKSVSTSGAADGGALTLWRAGSSRLSHVGGAVLLPPHRVSARGSSSPARVPLSIATAPPEGAGGQATRERKPRPAKTVQHVLTAAWQLAQEPLAGVPGSSGEPLLIWNGLRVRCSVASGLEEAPSVSRVSRASYASTGLMEQARALEGAAHGGQVLLSAAALSALGQVPLPEHIVLVHAGKHLLPMAAAKPPPPPAAAAAAPATAGSLSRAPTPGPDSQGTAALPSLAEPASQDQHTTSADSNLDPVSPAAVLVVAAAEGRLTGPANGAVPWAPDERSSQPVVRTLTPVALADKDDAAKAMAYVDVYSALHVRHLARMTTLPPLRVAGTLVLDVLHAPVDVVSIAFTHLVGYETLRAWCIEEADAAQTLFVYTAKHELRAAKGYLVEVAEGFVLTSFSDPGAALRWALATQSRMLRLPWSPKLLEHELGEEVHVMQTNSSLGPSRQPVVLFRGPRIKVGCDTGNTRSEVHATTRRIAYRGRVMNRAARIAKAAHSGQVLCSSEMWGAAAVALGGSAADAEVAGLQCLQLGPTELKGIKERINICQVTSDKSRMAWRSSLQLDADLGLGAYI